MKLSDVTSFLHRNSVRAGKAVAGGTRRLLSWSRLTDEHDGRLSLTNIAVLVAIVKLAVFVDAGATELVALATTLLAYGWKKTVNAQKVQQGESLEARVTGWEAKLKELKDLVALAPRGFR